MLLHLCNSLGLFFLELKFQVGLIGVKNWNYLKILLYISRFLFQEDWQNDGHQIFKKTFGV